MQIISGLTIVPISLGPKYLICLEILEFYFGKKEYEKQKKNTSLGYSSELGKFWRRQKKAKSLSGIVALSCEVKSEIVQKIRSRNQRK